MGNGEGMRPHKKLDVWHEAVDFVVDVYQVTKLFPKTEQYALADQLKRAAVSIPSNIVHPVEYYDRRFLSHRAGPLEYYVLRVHSQE